MRQQISLGVFITRRGLSTVPSPAFILHQNLHQGAGGSYATELVTRNFQVKNFSSLANFEEHVKMEGKTQATPFLMLGLSWGRLLRGGKMQFLKSNG